MAGELVGTAAPLLVSGGSSLLGRAATSGVRGAAALGVAAEGAAARGAMALGLREGGAAARAIGSAAGLGAESALYGVGAEVSRATLANEALDGEKLAAAGLHGALVGAAMGGGGSLLVSGAKAAASKAAAGLLDGGTALAERVGGKAATVAREGETLSDKATRLVDAASPGGAEAYAAERALKSTGGTSKQIGKMIDSGAGVKAAQQRILETDLPAALGKEPGAILSRPEMAEAIPAVIKQHGERIGASLKALDAVGAEGPSVVRIAEEAKPLLAKLEANPFSRSEAKQVAEALDAFGSYSVEQARLGRAVTFEGLHDLSSKLGERIRKGALTPEKESLSALRDLVENEIMRAGDAAAPKMGEAFAGGYREAKQGYVAAKQLEKAVQTGVERESSNASQGLREMLGGLGGGNLGSAIGGTLGGPVGAFVGGAVGSVASSYLANLSRRYGDQAAAAVLREVARGRPLSEAVGVVVDQVVSSSVRGFFGKAAGGTGRVLGAAARGGRVELAKEGAEALGERARGKEYKAAVDRVAELSAQAKQTAAQLPAGTPPAAAQSAQATAERGAAFLRGKLPPTPGQASSLQPHLSRAQPSPEAQAKFLRYVRAVDDPSSVLRDLQRGRIGREGIEAIKAVYPELFGQIQREVAAALADHRGRLSTGQARELGLLLGVEADPSQSAGMARALAAVYAPQAPGGAPGAAPGGGPPKRPLNASRLYNGKEGEDLHGWIGD